MKLISLFKIGEVVRFADADYEVINHSLSGCTVRAYKKVVHQIKDKVITIRPSPFQVSNMTEIEEG